MGETEDRLQPYVDLVMGLVQDHLKNTLDKTEYETYIEMIIGRLYSLPVFENE